MAVIANIKEFKIGDDFEVFAERLEQYFNANAVTGEKKIAVLLTVIEEEQNTEKCLFSGKTQRENI